MKIAKLFDLKKLLVAFVVVALSGCELEKLFVAIELKNVSVSEVIEQKIKSLGEKASDSCIAVADTNNPKYVCYSKSNVIIFARYLKEKSSVTADDYIETENTDSSNFKVAATHKLLASKIESFFTSAEKPTRQNRILSYDEVKSFRSGW